MTAANPSSRLGPVLIWIIIGVLSALALTQRASVDWISSYPETWTLPVAQWTNQGMDWFVDHFRWLFRAISWALTWPMDGLVGLLTWLPWPTTICLFAGIAFVAGGWTLALFTVASLVYMAAIGYWVESMRTLALVAVSVPMSVLVGFALGVSAWRSERANRIVQPLLDLMQTVPTFAYLIPILLLFGFGPVVHGGECDLCLPADGAKHLIGAAAGACRNRRVRRDGRGKPPPALLVGPVSKRSAHHPDRR